MKIQQNAVVTFHYRLTDDTNGETLESTYDDAPNVYVHGVDGLLDGLVRSLEGKSAGESFDVVLAPEEAYGHYNEEAKGRVAAKHVFLPGGKPVKGKLKPGTEVEVRAGDDLVDGIVIKHGLKTVDIDVNHPYAGKSLRFAVEVMEVRAATAGELTKNSGHKGCSCC